MTKHHARFLLLEQGLGSALFNLLLNAGIAWVMFHHLTVVPMWGQQSIGGDTLGTCFFLPFLTGLIVTALVRRRIRANRLAPLEWTGGTAAWLDWLPSGTTKRSALLGLGSLLTVGPLAILALQHASVSELSLPQFVAFKALFAAALALLVTPIISLWALSR